MGSANQGKEYFGICGLDFDDAHEVADFFGGEVQFFAYAVIVSGSGISAFTEGLVVADVVGHVNEFYQGL